MVGSEEGLVMEWPSLPACDPQEEEKASCSQHLVPGQGHS